MSAAAIVTRAQVEDFLYLEAALLDEWRMDEWLELLTDDARYEVPPNDVPGGSASDTLFTIADDISRIRARVKRLYNDRAHAEYPHSRTRHMISNVRITDRDGDTLSVSANFICHRFRRNERIRQYGGGELYAGDRWRRLQDPAPGGADRRPRIGISRLGQLYPLIPLTRFGAGITIN